MVGLATMDAVGGCGRCLWTDRNNGEKVVLKYSMERETSVDVAMKRLGSLAR